MSLGDPELDTLLLKAKAAFDVLTPEQKAAHRREQYISFAYGNLALSTNHKVSRQQVVETVDRMEAAGELDFTRPDD